MSRTNLSPMAPCPFCGHRAQLRHPEGSWKGQPRRFFQVRCGNPHCGVQPFTQVTIDDPTGQKDVWPTAKDAIRIWNQRPPP